MHPFRPACAACRLTGMSLVGLGLCLVLVYYRNLGRNDALLRVPMRGGADVPSGLCAKSFFLVNL